MWGGPLETLLLDLAKPLADSGYEPGALFVESAFAIPGLGQLFFSAIRTADYPLLTGATIVSAFWIMLLNLLIDLLYGALDPRVRY